MCNINGKAQCCPCRKGICSVKDEDVCCSCKNGNCTSPDAQTHLCCEECPCGTIQVAHGDRRCRPHGCLNGVCIVDGKPECCPCEQRNCKAPASGNPLKYADCISGTIDLATGEKTCSPWEQVDNCFHTINYFIYYLSQLNRNVNLKLARAFSQITKNLRCWSTFEYNNNVDIDMWTMKIQLLQTIVYINKTEYTHLHAIISHGMYISGVHQLETIFN